MKVERIQEIFNRLEGLVISLPNDPLELGPDYLREQISICRGYLNECSMYLQRILSERTLSTMKLEALETEYAIKSDELLTGDERVKVLPALADRHAMINNILLKERREIETLKLEIKSSGHVEKVVRLRHKELDNTMSAIRLQRSLLKDQLKTGSFYGDESYEARSDSINDVSAADLNALLEESEAELDAENIDLVEDVESEAEPIKKAVKPKAERPKKKPKTAPEPEDEFGDLSDEDDDLQDEVDALLEEGGIDVTLPAEPIEKKGKKGKKSKGEILKPEEPKLTKDDVDEDMEDFLNTDFEDDLDSFLDDD